MKNAHNLCFVGVYYFTITYLQLIIQISVKQLKLFYVFNGFSWIRIQGNDTDSTDPDPPHWYCFVCSLEVRNYQCEQLRVLTD